MSGTGPSWSGAYASAGADSMAVYDEVLVPRVFAPWAELLLDHVGVAAGDEVLDVATGPGTVARRAALRAGPSGRVTACDLSPAMLELARAKSLEEDAAPIHYLECPADSLAVPEGAFDVVLCQQGLQFFPDRHTALREMHRALRPRSGCAGVSVWCAIEECPPFAASAVAIAEVFGEEVALAFRGGPWGLPDPDQLRLLFEAVGFSGISVERHTLPVVFEGGVSQVVLTMEAAPALRPLVAALDEEGRARLFDATARAVEPLMDGGAIRSELASHVVVAGR